MNDLNRNRQTWVSPSSWIVNPGYIMEITQIGWVSQMSRGIKSDSLRAYKD